jgi:hypothetical protein
MAEQAREGVSPHFFYLSYSSTSCHLLLLAHPAGSLDFLWEHLRYVLICQKTAILSGCIFYLNGSTGPKVSNLQLQNIITSNGGTFM